MHPYSDTSGFFNYRTTTCCALRISKCTHVVAIQPSVTVGVHSTQYKEEGRLAIGLEGHMAQIREETPRASR